MTIEERYRQRISREYSYWDAAYPGDPRPRNPWQRLVFWWLGGGW